MYNEKICNATASSFIKKRNKIPFTYFNDISNKLLEYHYSISNNRTFNKYFLPLGKKINILYRFAI